MPDKLVIVESPAKAKTIGKILGKDYIIKASYGHIRDLPERAFIIEHVSTLRPKKCTRTLSAIEQSSESGIFLQSSIASSKESLYPAIILASVISKIVQVRRQAQPAKNTEIEATKEIQFQRPVKNFATFIKLQDSAEFCERNAATTFISHLAPKRGISARSPHASQ